MKTLRAHFDGKVLQLDEPVDLPVDQPLEIQIRPVAVASEVAAPLKKLVAMLKDLPADPDWPADGAAQHDHYLYGTPKRT